MKKRMEPLVIGNWKMNPQSASLALKLATELKKKLQVGVSDGIEVVVAPPFTYIESIKGLNGNRKKSFWLGAQTTHHAKLGAFTGEISLPMLIDLEVSHVIVGHSERRALGESDEMVNEKLVVVVKAGLTGIVCVGEKERDPAGHYLNHIEGQIRKALAGITKARLDHIVIAYEPLWAIGSGENATAHDIHEMKLFIEKAVSDIYGRTLAQKVRIIYGGSVNKRNARELHHDGMMNGFLVGGASLHADEFIEIIKLVKQA